MRLSVGTSGYSYKGWKGVFYPDDLPAREMLRFYAGRLPAVEINNTFYRLPKTALLESWAGQVPEDFRFSIKASQRITHRKRLKDAADETGYLLETTSVLGARLGVILFQLPPYLKVDADRLAEFLTLLPPGTRAAFEFRHPSWENEAVYGLLRERDCALCIADTDGREETPLVRTAGWGYLRLRRPSYDDAELRRWAAAVRSQDWEEAFIFFKHEDEGAGPRMAARFLELAAAPA
jgi:uncharacterized protein YecE (DUF72 family)